MSTPTKTSKPTQKGPLVVQALLLVILLACLCRIVLLKAEQTPLTDEKITVSAVTPQPVVPTPTPATPTPSAVIAAPVDTPPVETEELPPEPTPTPIPTFEPYHTENTDPAKYIKNVAIQIDGRTLGAGEVYEAAEPIDFTFPEDYTDVDGIITFRGDNFRSSAAYGYADMEKFKFGSSWHVSTGSLTHNGAVWTGNGWVGQPLIVKWPASTKAVMNMYDWAKEDDELVEVIYAAMDGYIYFLDLNSGQRTRDSLYLGYTFKGAGALDPRGYPLLYLGSGYDSDRGTSRVFIISLLDGSVLYQFGNNDSFSLRGSLSYFDSSALVDAETDQLIYPGENGILYLIKLNSQYDEEAGTLSIDPGPMVKWHYYGTRTSLGSYWIGMEDSAVIWRGHIIMSDNGGNLMCLNLNTLELDWVQDVLDDTNGSPVLSMEDGHPYIYISTSFHYGWRSWTTATIPVWKIDAENGEIIWHTDFTCHTESGVSGGVQSTIGLGQNDLEGLIYVTVAKTDNLNNGFLVCLDRESGEIVWQQKAYYTWSSPVLVYNQDGSGYVCYCTYGNTLYLMDGKSGEVLDTFDLRGGVEASPAVYKDTLVIGTRQCLIWGIKLT